MTDKLDERKALEELIAAYIEDRRNSGHGGNAPGHAHDVPGVWDADNVPTKRGTKCRWCAAWFAARAVLATAPAEPPHAEDRIERAVLIKQLRDAADALEYADGYIEGALEVIDAYAEEKAATPSRLASGPSQEGAGETAAATPFGEVAALSERLRRILASGRVTLDDTGALAIVDAMQALARLSAPVPDKEK